MTDFFDGNKLAASSRTDDAGRNARPRHGLISSSSVGSANRGRLLQALFDLGPTSRADLARYTGVNRATISGIIQPLVDQKVLVEGEAIPANESGGKPARPLWFSKDAQPICAVLLMHDSVRSCLVSLNGEIYAESESALPIETGDVRIVMDIIVDCIRTTLSAAARPALGIGVAAVGMIDTDKRSIVAVNLAPLLDGFPLGQELESQFALPTSIDHHPRALLVGDRWFGLGRGRRNFAAVYTGEVLGGALFLDGHLFRGPGGAGGELGHTFVQLGGRRCKCGRIGCWETIATLGWLREEASQHKLPEAATMNSAKLVELAEAGVDGAAVLLDRYAQNIAVGIANLQQTMAPNYIILHGDVVGGGKALMGAISEHLRELVPWRPGGEMELALGEKEDVAALRGAAGLVLSELLQFPL